MQQKYTLFILNNGIIMIQINKLNFSLVFFLHRKYLKVASNMFEVFNFNIAL